MVKILMTFAIIVLSIITSFGQIFTEDFNDFTWGDFSWETSTGNPAWTGDGQAKDWTFQEGFINATSYGGNQIKHWAVGGSEGDPTYAGGTGAEVKIDGHLGTDYPTPYERTARFISPIINTTGMEALSISFKHQFVRVDSYEGMEQNVNVGIATTSDGGTTWNTVWDSGTLSSAADNWEQAYTLTSIIDNNDVGSANFQICFYMEDCPFYVNQWAFDDIEISVLPNIDVMVDEITIDEQHAVGENLNPSAHIINKGVAPSVTFDAICTFTEYETGSVVYNETKSITLNRGEDSTITFPQYTFTDAGKVYTVNVTTNAVGDANPDDNSLTKDINTWSQLRQKVLIESSTYTT